MSSRSCRSSPYVGHFDAPLQGRAFCDFPMARANENATIALSLSVRAMAFNNNKRYNVTKQLMIYDNIQPLSDKHRGWSVNVQDFNYIRHLNSVPLLATEIPFASAEYPVIFSATSTPGEYIPLAVLGLKEGENLLVDADGKFDARYVPAFVRRYPFVLAGSPDAETLTVCIDEDSTAVHKDGASGKPLFEEGGEQTQHLKDVIEFLKDYQYRAEMTKVFCSKLHELNLLEPMQANITFKEHQESNLNLTGFFVVKREKLKEISDEAALELFKKDGLELIYAHLQSLNNLNLLINKMSGRLAGEKKSA